MTLDDIKFPLTPGRPRPLRPTTVEIGPNIYIVVESSRPTKDIIIVLRIHDRLSL